MPLPHTWTALLVHGIFNINNNLRQFFKWKLLTLVVTLTTVSDLNRVVTIKFVLTFATLFVAVNRHPYGLLIFLFSFIIGFCQLLCEAKLWFHRKFLRFNWFVFPLVSHSFWTQPLLRLRHIDADVLQFSGGNSHLEVMVIITFERILLRVDCQIDSLLHQCGLICNNWLISACFVSCFFYHFNF